MEMFFLLILVSLTYIHSVSVTENCNCTCDFTFGNPTWNYSKVFYNEDVIFPAGAKNHSVVLPGHRVLMVSYVCVILPDAGVDKNTTTAAFHPVDREVSLVLAKQATQDFPYHIYAKRHGY